MSKKRSLTPIDPSEDKSCPEGTKKRLLERGLRPYRKESGRIVWESETSVIYRTVQKKQKPGPFIHITRIGKRKLKTWLKLLIIVLIVGMLGYLFLMGFISIPF